MVTLRTETDDTTLTARLKGRLGGDNALELKAELDDHIGDQTKLVLDLGQLDYISSAVLRIVALLATDAKNSGYGFSLSRPKVEVDFILRMSGFHKMMIIHPTIEEALA